MTRKQLADLIVAKQSLLCVGLDPDWERIPDHLKSVDDPIFAFNKAIIDATLPYAIAYKPNLAFYEAHGISGWEALEKTIAYIPDSVFTIADAKRGDIGNTSRKYAEAFLTRLGFDSITISPYMGIDSVTPFLSEGKWIILLAATSNKGSFDFQHLRTENDCPLYTDVIRASQAWGTPDNMMYVLGATQPETIGEVRKLIPEHFLLIPGVGAQGGDLEQVCTNGLNDQGGLLINSSRGILYAGKGEGFAKDAANAAKDLQEQMAKQLHKHGLIAI